MQKCSLCGGKVVNGRCEDCGMPIPPEHRYVLRGETVHTHEVNGEKILHRVRQRPEKKTEQQRMPWSVQARRTSGGAHPYLGRKPGQESGKQLASRLVWGIVVLVILLNLLPVLFTSCAA